jgi:hypothetical protein
MLTTPLKPPTPSPKARPPESPAPVASGSPLWDKPDPLALMALVARKAQTHERLGDGALLALLPHEQQHPRPPRLMVDGPLPGGRGGGGGALAFPVEQARAEGQVAGAGGGGEEGFVPENVFAVAAGALLQRPSMRWIRFRDERPQRTSINVSASTPAWRSTLARVPTARSRRWRGTTQVTLVSPLSGLGDCLCSTTWLPFWRTILKPRRYSRLGALFQIKLGGLAQVGEGLLDRIALAGGSDLRTLRHVDLVFLVKDRCEALGCGGCHRRLSGATSSLTVRVAWRCAPQTANPAVMPSNSRCATQQPCSQAAGICRSSRQRIATLEQTRSSRPHGSRNAQTPGSRTAR